MLLQFSVSNFYSIKDKCTLSLEATADESLPNNRLATGLEDLPYGLASAVIFGANASGKTNFLKALDFFVALATTGDTRLVNLKISQFAFNKKNLSMPVVFEIVLLIDSDRFIYRVEVNYSSVVSEELTQILPDLSEVLWYVRKSVPGTREYLYNFNESIIGISIEQLKTISQRTRPERLFIDIAVIFNVQSFEPIVNCFKRIEFVESNVNYESSNRLLEIGNGKKLINQLMSHADTGITEVQFKKLPPVRVKQSAGIDKEEEQNQLFFIHKFEDTNFNFSRELESTGTLKLYGLAGRIIEALNNGKVLIFDELENSLHLHLLEKIIEIFHDSKLNKNKAQLIFSSHNFLLMGQMLFRPDQLWIMEKQKDQSSKLVPLSDFDIPEDKSVGFELMRHYKAGRLGGVPLLPRKLIGD